MASENTIKVFWEEIAGKGYSEADRAVAAPDGHTYTFRPDGYLVCPADCGLGGPPFLLVEGEAEECVVALVLTEEAPGPLVSVWAGPEWIGEDLGTPDGQIRRFREREGRAWIACPANAIPIAPEFTPGNPLSEEELAEVEQAEQPGPQEAPPAALLHARQAELRAKDEAIKQLSVEVEALKRMVEKLSAPAVALMKAREAFGEAGEVDDGTPKAEAPKPTPRSYHRKQAASEAPDAAELRRQAAAAARKATAGEDE